MIRSHDSNLNLSDHQAATITKLIELWDYISDQQQGTNTNFKVSTSSMFDHYYNHVQFVIAVLLLNYVTVHWIMLNYVLCFCVLPLCLQGDEVLT